MRQNSFLVNIPSTTTIIIILLIIPHMNPIHHDGKSNRCARFCYCFMMRIFLFPPLLNDDALLNGWNVDYMSKFSVKTTKANDVGPTIIIILSLFLTFRPWSWELFVRKGNSSLAINDPSAVVSFHYNHHYR